MKKLILILKVIALLVVTQMAVEATAQAKTKALPRQQITALVSDFSGQEGFEVVRVGRLGMGLVKSLMRRAVRESGDEEVLGLLRGIKSVSVVHFEDAAPGVKARFVRRLDRMLEGVDLLMEAKSDGEEMRVFGVVDEDGSKVTDFVAYSPKDCVLICLYGSMSTRQLAKIMED